MDSLVKSHAFRAWAVLVVVTLVSWLLAEKTGAARLAASAAVLIAGFKVNLVVARFMELRWRPAPWRWVLTAWIAGVVAIILGGYWLVILRG